VLEQAAKSDAEIEKKSMASRRLHGLARLTRMAKSRVNAGDRAHHEHDAREIMTLAGLRLGCRRGPENRK